MIKDRDRKNIVHIVPNPLGYKKEDDTRYMLLVKLFIPHRDLLELKGSFDTYKAYFYQLLGNMCDETAWMKNRLSGLEVCEENSVYGYH